MEDLAYAGGVLKALNLVTDKAKAETCKRAAYIAQRTPQQEKAWPSTIYHKSEVFKYFECDILAGVKKEMMDLMGVTLDNDVETLSLEENYFGFLIYKNL